MFKLAVGNDLGIGAQVTWFWVERSTLVLGLTGIWHGFELYERLLVTVLFRYCSMADCVTKLHILWLMKSVTSRRDDDDDDDDDDVCSAGR